MEMWQYWKTVVETTPDGVILVDPDGKILSTNPAALRLTGYQADELVGQSCRVLDCTGCEIIGRGSAEKWCKLFTDGEVRGKKCLITNKSSNHVNVIKNAKVLQDESGRAIGAVETLTDTSELVSQQMEIRSLRQILQLEDGYHGLIGKAPVMQNFFELIEKVAVADAPVVITGQSGTGKELVARAIHERSPRRRGPFVKVNCAALNENLLESELFGHVKGAFTGASGSRIGRFEAAQGGTIFLDEIADVPLTTQIKLLRTLEEKEIEKVGTNHPVKVDVRIVSATNKNLEALIAGGQFREDLYFRINVFPITCPPLADRIEDIPVIVQHFIKRNNQKTGKKVRGLTPEAIEKIFAYGWPGNVRELRNAIDYAFVLCAGSCIGIEHLPASIISSSSKPSNPEVDKLFLEKKNTLIRVLRQTKGNQSKAARLLGVSRVTIWKQINRFGIDIHRELAV